MQSVLSVLLLSVVLVVTSADDVKTTNEVPQPAAFVPAAPAPVTSGIDNPNFEPTMYATFVPQDSVQQYVSNYGGNGYTGPTTLEGFLIPALKQTTVAPLATPSFIQFVKSYLPGPRILLAIILKFVALIGSAIGVVLFGGAITSFLCAFTPLCSITVLGTPLNNLKNQTSEIVEQIGNEVTAERVKRAADLFKLAVEKYQQMQKQK